jgi:UTP--glucose-1-phosphate uridylyltransferase
MASSIRDQLSALPAPTRKLLHEHRFDVARFERLAARLRAGETISNRERGSVEAPAPGDVAELPQAGSAAHARLAALGRDALAADRVALVVLAGGMATRMGGVVKALVEALPGKTFLDLRLAELDAHERDHGVRPPLWLMTSDATDAAIRQALADRLDGERIAAFTQHLSLRLTPEGEVFRDPSGEPSVHAPGHGDLPDALRESGLLARFVGRGGRVLMVANLDNLGATLDPAIIGFHLEHGQPVTCEVVEKVGSDKGGIPVRLGGRPVVLEEFRLPEGFDPARVRVFNTNTFELDARALLELKMDFTFFLVEKKVEEHKVVQFERLIGEVTSQLGTRFLRVPRDGASSRFLPVKDHDELAQRRPEIEAVARARGMLG